MTLLVRDEQDIVDSHLRFHLANGVDHVVATDHRSVDATTEILRRYERDGVLHLIRESGEEFRQSAWVTRMARLAATDFGADWVVNADVDEFLWPRDGTLREILAAVPPRFGVVYGLWRHFVMRPETGEPFFERMTVRTRPVLARSSPYVGALKAVHRSDPAVVVGRGNHKARGRGLVPLADWLPFEVLHFPIRTREQLERKYRREEVSQPSEVGIARHVAGVVDAFDAYGVDRVASHLLVDDAALERGLAEETLDVDVRLRDALRHPSASVAGAPEPTIEADVMLAVEAAPFLSSESMTRLSWRLGRLAERVAAVERAVGRANRRA